MRLIFLGTTMTCMYSLKLCNDNVEVSIDYAR